MGAVFLHHGVDHLQALGGREWGLLMFAVWVFRILDPSFSFLFFSSTDSGYPFNCPDADRRSVSMGSIVITIARRELRSR